jgi:excisionase family DNA binding protein
MREPRQHLTVTQAAARLGHGRRWVLDRVASGELEGFRHGYRDVTISHESIVAYEERVRMHAGSAARVDSAA